MNGTRYDTTPWVQPFTLYDTAPLIAGFTLYDTAQILKGYTLYGNAGFGVVGSQIASTGDDGPGYAYTSLSLPTDASTQIDGRILVYPADGALSAGEDTGFEYTGVMDGTRSFWWQFYKAGLATVTPDQVMLIIGTPPPVTGNTSATIGPITAFVTATQLRRAAVSASLGAISASIVAREQLPNRAQGDWQLGAITCSAAARFYHYNNQTVPSSPRM